MRFEIGPLAIELQACKLPGSNKLHTGAKTTDESTAADQKSAAADESAVLPPLAPGS